MQISQEDRSAFQKGLKRAILYYLVGLLVSFVAHQVFGWSYFYIPPKSFLIILIVLIVGLPWAIINLTSLLNHAERPRAFGELLVHSIVFSIFIILLQLLKIV
jgi:asparagine N-glycosylation enzyme membrane subunit Stt3